MKGCICCDPPAAVKDMTESERFFMVGASTVHTMALREQPPPLCRAHMRMFLNVLAGVDAAHKASRQKVGVS